MSMKKIFVLIISALIFQSCSVSDPQEMAKEYCDCIKNASNDSDYQTCLELAKAHKEQLEGNKDQLEKYSDELVNCTNVSK
jgi:PBP1b-binding outer membrane lipoprotein LpoB